LPCTARIALARRLRFVGDRQQGLFRLGAIAGKPARAVPQSQLDVDRGSAAIEHVERQHQIGVAVGVQVLGA